jgi:hypothetical protein
VTKEGRLPGIPSATTSQLEVFTLNVVGVRQRQWDGWNVLNADWNCTRSRTQLRITLPGRKDKCEAIGPLAWEIDAH